MQIKKDGAASVDNTLPVAVSKSLNDWLFLFSVKQFIFASSFEVDILSNLLKAQCEMAEWKFLPSLLHLHESNVKLSSWCQILPPVEVGKCLFVGNVIIIIIIIITVIRLVVLLLLHFKCQWNMQAMLNLLSIITETKFGHEKYFQNYINFKSKSLICFIIFQCSFCKLASRV